MRPVITLTTDFGPGRYVAQMKGVLLSLCPDAVVVDIDHGIPPQDLVSTALLLKDVVSAYPEGTVHVVVVDPGVGTKRRGVVLRAGPAARGQYFIGPDNGIFGEFAEGGEMRLLEARAFMRDPVSPTFHGRDVFAPAAAHLARGVALDRFGPRVGDPQRLALPVPRRIEGGVVGEALYADHFGNIVTSIGESDLPSAGDDGLRVELGWARLEKIARTYAEVRVGEMLALIGSSGRLEVAVREGSAAQRLQLKPLRGTPVKVTRGRPSLYE